MSGLLSTLVNALIRSRENRGRNVVRDELLSKDDRFLADIGISRELLEEGVGAWPWRIDQLANDETRATARPRSTSKDFVAPADFTAMGMASKGARGYEA